MLFIDQLVRSKATCSFKFSRYFRDQGSVLPPQQSAGQMLVLKHTEDQSKFTQVVHWWFNIKKHPILFQIMTREKVGGLVKYLVTVGQTFQAIFIQNNYDFSTGSKKQTKVRKISCLLLQKIMCTAFQTNNYFRFCEIFIFKSKYYL